MLDNNAYNLMAQMVQENKKPVAYQEHIPAGCQDLWRVPGLLGQALQEKGRGRQGTPGPAQETRLGVGLRVWHAWGSDHCMEAVGIH